MQCKPFFPRIVSIRSPHRSKGRQPWADRILFAGKVSIRSPHRSKGRRTNRCCSRSPSPCFNPLPSPKQGETCGTGSASPNCRVSIRSPHRSKGRRQSITNTESPKTFQSAPLTEARGDRHDSPCLRMVGRFNPLPSPKQGETGPRSIATQQRHLFQSAPLTEARGDL